MAIYIWAKRHMILLILLVFFFNASLCWGQESSRSQIDNGSVNASLMTVTPRDSSNQTNVASTVNITNTSATGVLNLRYIWSVSGIEKDQVTLALNQKDSALFGQAKYEPGNDELWNGVVAGFVSGNEVHLAIAALINKEKVSIVLDGIFANEAIRGKFFKASEGNISGSGEFNAIWINPDLSSYSPARIHEISPVPTTNATALADTNKASLQVAAQDSRFHDVHQDADRILTGVGDISQIPIGMSGL
jgi:hypothetical protein